MAQKNASTGGRGSQPAEGRAHSSALDLSTDSGLVLQFPIHEGETLRSYLARVAVANGLKTERALLLKGRRSPKTGSQAWYETLSRSTGSSVSAISAAYKGTFGPLPESRTQPSPVTGSDEIDDFGSSHYTTHVRNGKMIAFCPRCLVDGLFERAAWAPIYSLYCSQHNCYLLLTCKHCNSNIDSIGLAAGICTECGKPLKEMSTSGIPPQEERVLCQALIDYWWQGNVTPPEANLPEADAAAVFQVLHGLTRLLLCDDYVGLRRASPRWFKKIVRSPRPLAQESLAQTLMIAYRAIANWPRSFTEFLEFYVHRTGSRRSLSPANDLGALYKNLLPKLSADQGYGFINATIDEYIINHYQFSRTVEKLDRYRSQPAFRAGFQYISASEAARRLGISPRMIEVLVGNNMLKAVKRVGTALGAELWVAALEVDQLLGPIGESLDYASAAKKLGVTENQLAVLASSGLLKFIDSDRIDTGPRIETRSMNALKLGLALVEQCAATDTIALTMATNKLKPFGYGIDHIVSAVLKDSVKAARIGKAILDIGVSSKDFDKLRRLVIKQHHLDAVKSLARNFGSGAGQVFSWIELGLLDSWLDAGSHPFDTTCAEYEAFCRRYVSFRHAMTITGMQWPMLQTHVNRGQFRPVGKVGGRGASGLLFREDVEKWSRDQVLTS